MPPHSSSLRTSFLLFFTVMSLLPPESSTIPRDQKEELLDPSETTEAREDFRFGPRDGDTFPQMDAAFLLEDEEQATRVWPRTIQDYMRHQLRFRGRTKKSTIGPVHRFTV